MRSKMTFRLSSAALVAAAVLLAGCENAMVDKRTQGQVIGGVAGAALGSTMGSGSGRLVATGAGAVLGTMAGGAVGERL